MMLLSILFLLKKMWKWLLPELMKLSSMVWVLTVRLVQIRTLLRLLVALPINIARLILLTTLKNRVVSPLPICVSVIVRSVRLIWLQLPTSWLATFRHTFICMMYWKGCRKAAHSCWTLFGTKKKLKSIFRFTWRNTLLKTRLISISSTVRRSVRN